MDKIVMKVLDILSKRQTNSMTFYINSNQPFSKTGFLYHKHIKVKEATIQELHQLVNHVTNDWVCWINEGLTLNNQFHFYLTKDLWQVIPKDLLLNWPILFYDSNGFPIKALKEHVITYEAVATIPSNSYLIKFNDQLLTDYAKEMCLKNSIKILERV